MYNLDQHQESVIKYPWEAVGNFALNSNSMIQSLMAKLDHMGSDIAAKDEVIKTLSFLADARHKLNQNLQKQIDVMIGVLAHLKSADSMEEVDALLSSYEVHGYSVPYLV